MTVVYYEDRFAFDHAYWWQMIVTAMIIVNSIPVKK